MHLLVTNDDGVHAPGLMALAQAMRTLGEISILAPDRNWSASGHVKTMHRPLRAWETTLADDTPALTSDGAPSDCVAMAILGLIRKPIDVVVSGINPHGNFGHDVTYSGTVTAAMEAAIAGLPGLAFSLETPNGLAEPPDFAPAARVAGRLVSQIMRQPLPPGILLNVNIPYLPEDAMRGVIVTRQGLRVYRDELVERRDPRGRPYYWIGGDAPSGIADPGTDFGAISEGYISITPIRLDLTAYDQLDLVTNWDLQLEPPV
jgi:5'-nucleotidase